MNQSLLICIAFHYIPERFFYLNKILNEFIDSYKMPLHIIIDTNSDIVPIAHNLTSTDKQIEIVIHKHLQHPFHLTSMHRRHIKENIDNYDVVMYIEDDILLPYKNYLNYLENFKILYPEYVPSFIRIETGGGGEYVSDVIKHHSLDVIEKEGKQFASFPFPENYHGFWLMPTKELKPLISETFTILSDFREQNAMFPEWVSGKTGLVEIEYRQVSTKCFAYHLPNNYINSEMPNAKIKANEIFI